MLKKLLEIAHDASTIIDHNICELLYNYTIAINGKSKFIDCLYLIRGRHPDLPLISSGDYFELLTRKNWSHDYNRMVDSLSLLLSDDKKMSFPEAKKIISDLMKERLKYGFLKQYTKTEDYKKIFYAKLKNIMPDYLKNKLKLMKNILLNKEMSLLMTKGSRFHSDFLPVENSLTGKGLCNDEK